MNTLPISQIPFIPLEEADPDLAKLYDEIQSVTQAPVVSNVWQILGNSMGTLTGTWHLFFNLYLEGGLPMTLKALILFSIAATHRCRYCGAIHEVTCRMLSIDEAHLQTIVDDLSYLTPDRTRKIIQFALRCADEPSTLTEAHYDEIREIGLTEGELVEIISLAAMGTYLDILADALKLEVDDYLQELLPGGQMIG
jgi:uncharacterized peroxidase-related enzyme